MIMDPHFNGFFDPLNGFKESNFTGSDEYFNLENDFKFKDETIDLSFMDNHNHHHHHHHHHPHRRSDDVVSGPPFASFSSQEESSSSDNSDLSDPVFKYISQMLMEEDMDEKPSMLHDSLALHVAEKSLYEALGRPYPPSPDQPPLLSLDSPENNMSRGFSDDYSNNSNGSNSGSITMSNSVEAKQPESLYNNNWNGFNEFKPVTSLQLPDFFSNSESILQFNKGVEEASKFLPKASNLIVDLDTYTSAATETKEVVANNVVVVKVEDEEKELSPNGSKGRKRGDMDLEEERVNKHSAIYVDEEELSEMFDRVLLSCKVEPPEPYDGIPIDDPKNVQSQALSNGKGRGKKQGDNREVVDLRTLLILCAQAVSGDDRRTANDLLRQIRQHSSPLGDGSQRLAHCFANGLEARLSGTGTQIYTALASKRTSAADILKAYQLYIQACPFKKVGMGFANQMILKAAEKAKTLHIIDFGILYGFQWPILICHISKRDGGPPKLRVTGIELPQSGFRPAERVEETGRRLAKYCERFNVPFEYNAIAQKWDTIQVKDLKIRENEVVAVNCLYRFRNLLDETVTVKSPRNAVLNLIRQIKPNVFAQSVVNGSYNAPFFVTRFREALFHYSALFDMFDTIVPRDNPERLMFEREFYGREVMNVTACEGSERVERPETYKQWQVRIARAGFRQLPLDKEIMSALKEKCKEWYHKDFVVDQDGGWVLSGWKGRIICASSCWYPA